ncbi:hypothetical protein ARMSODRAFT_983738 [Armillaria solidipes]|uniref:Uncharacterized protein n=1 Tax=Armillaria solidipes TaxID=1076256 RepID=A0A2H3AI65_9AGAR|nr:hypothetical protein ARMSODRAFT_983738 [Armillaria solidipes]
MSCLPARVLLVRRLSSNPEERDEHKCSGWSPKGAMFTGVKLNADKESEAGVVMSLSQIIVLLRLVDNGSLHEIRSIKADLHPVNITDNWKTDERAYLNDVGDNLHDHYLQVVFTPTTILVICARSIILYASTVNGASATPTSILICSKNGNPWASELNSLELSSLSSFPPTLVSKISSQRGALRCTDIILDKRATAVWIRPHDRVIVSLEYSLHSGQYNLGTAPLSEKDLGKDSDL